METQKETTKRVTKGQRIRTVYQNWYTAISQWDNIITTYEGHYIHIAKVVEVR